MACTFICFKNQIGYYFEEAEVIPQLPVISGSVGRVLDNTEKPMGTFFTIVFNGRRCLVSAAHCFNEIQGRFDERLLVFPDGTRINFYPNTVINEFLLFDDVIISPLPENGPAINCLPISSEEVNPNRMRDQKVLTIGYPIRYLRDSFLAGPVISVGIILDGYPYREWVINSNARAEGGNSGSPLVNECGIVIGVTIQSVPEYRLERELIVARSSCPNSLAAPLYLPLSSRYEGMTAI